MELLKACDFEKIVNKDKNTKFQSMLNFQNKIIKENMLNQKRSVLFVFSDREQFCDHEKKWQHDFYKNAKEMFEKNGFYIDGSIIRW